MASKVLIYLGLLLAFVLLVSSQVASADKSIDPKKEEVTSETNGVEEAKYGGYNNGGGYRGGGGGYNNGGGGYNNGGGGYNNGGGGYNNGGGGYNNGGGYRGGGGYPGRGGGGGGGYCRYGCCGGSSYGRGCRRCCSYAGEAATATTPGN